jgi:tripartite-type tricarboxylate transporter receptor subunit TctC
MPPRSFAPSRRACLALALALPSIARAQATRGPLRLIVGTGPGTGSDLLLRIVAARMGEIMGQAVVVENRAGGGGTVAHDQLLRGGPRDGTALVMGTTSTLITSPILNRSVTYDALRDFTAVTGLARSPFVLTVAERPGAPTTVRELLDLLGRTDASFGTPGVGTFPHLLAEMLLHRAGRRATHVPFRESPPSLSAVAAGDLAFAFETVAAASSAIEGRRVRPIAVTGEGPVASLPGVPTMTQALGQPFVIQAWWGLMAPAGTPAEALAPTGEAARQALANPETVQRLSTLALEPMPLTGPDFAALIAREKPFWQALVRDANISIDR